MKYIDLDAWNRNEHFHFFQRARNPVVGLTAQIGIGKLLEHRKANPHPKIRLTDLLYHCAMRAANAVPEFRMRLHNLRPVEFSRVDAAFTYVPRGRDLHANCIARYDEDFSLFRQNIDAARVRADNDPTLRPEGSERQDLVYLTCLPDVAFTSVSNPWGNPWEDTVPRITFGGYDKTSLTIPVSIEALHSFVDGRHIAELLQLIAEGFEKPGEGR